MDSTVKEDVEITVKETSDTPIIKELRENLTTNSIGSIIHRFEANGRLELIAVNSKLMRAGIRILNGFEIFSAKEFSGNQIWFPRMLCVNEINDPLNINGLVYDKFPLTGIIEINIEGGQPNESVELVVRWS